jgi:murein DD-endopeptidase MepM/ murein hydrolase activator NlpD
MSCFATFFSNAEYDHNPNVEFVASHNQNETKENYKYKVKDSSHIQSHHNHSKRTLVKSATDKNAVLLKKIPNTSTYELKNSSKKSLRKGDKIGVSIKSQNVTQDKINKELLKNPPLLKSFNANGSHANTSNANIKSEQKKSQSLQLISHLKQKEDKIVTQTLNNQKSAQTSQSNIENKTQIKSENNKQKSQLIQPSKIVKQTQSTQINDSKTLTKQQRITKVDTENHKDTNLLSIQIDHTSNDIKNLETQLQKSFKVKDRLPTWIVNIVKGSQYKIQYSKSSNTACIFIENSSVYIEVSKNGNKLTFAKKQIESKTISKKLQINGDFVAELRSIGISTKEIQNIMDVLKNLCKIEDINTRSINCSVIITFNHINSKFNDQITKNIVKISVTTDNNTYNIYGFRDSIKNGTFYNKEGVCLTWKNLSLPMKIFTINSPYGRRLHPVLKTYKFHHGIDLVAPRSAKIYSMCNGVIVKRQRSSTFGNCIFITNPETKRTYIYAHMESFAPNVEVGKTINMNQAIGTIGQTGRATGQHLHLEIRSQKNSSENPAEIFENLGKKLNADKLSEFHNAVKVFGNYGND